MNREIKFRAWVKSPVPKMCEITSLNFGWETGTGAEAMVKWFSDKPSQRLHPTEYELMQFTGLTDKNGKEIFEGDIVKWMPEEDKRDYTGFVFYFVDRAEYRINFGENHQFGFTTKSTEKEIEVIGNIYENPNLLDKEF